MRASGQLNAFMLAGASGQPNGEVEIGFGKIDSLVRGHQSEARVGVRLAECRQPRGQPFGGKIAWRSDGQRIGGLPRLHRADRLFKLQKARTQGIKAICRLVRELKPLGRAAEENDAQHIFQRAYLLADGRWRHRKLVRRLGKA